MKKISPWTDALVERLKTLYATSMSCAQIAAEMNCGFTRNSIIGKIARLELPPRKVEARAPPKPRERKVLNIENNGAGSWRVRESRAMVEQYKLRGVEIECTTTLIDNNGCWYPSHGDGPHLFCGGPKQPGSSYCTAHHHIVWVNPTRTERAAA